MARTKQTTGTTKSKEKTSTKSGSSYVYKAPNVQFTDIVHSSAYDMKLNEELSVSSQVVLNDDNEISIEADQFIEETSKNETNAHSKPMGNIFEDIVVDDDVANVAKVVAKMNGQFAKNIAKLNDQVALIEDRTREIQVKTEQQGYSRDNSKVQENDRRINEQKELIVVTDIFEKDDTIIAETPFKDDKRYEDNVNESLKDTISSTDTISEDQVNLNNPYIKLSSIREMIEEEDELNKTVSMTKYESSQDTSHHAEEQPILKNETQALREQISQDVRTVEHDTKEDNLSTKSKGTGDSNEVSFNKKFSHPPTTPVTANRRKMSADTQRRPNSKRLISRSSTSRPNSGKLFSRSSTSRPNSRRLTSRRNKSGIIQGYSFAQIFLCSVLLSAIISMAIGLCFQCSQRKMFVRMENRRNAIHRNKMLSFHNKLDFLNQTTNEDDFLELYLNKKIRDELKVLAEALEREKSHMNIVDKVRGMLNRNENEDTGKGDACEKRNLHASYENDG